MTLIYLASPYSHDNPQMRSHRAGVASQCAADLMDNQTIVYCPVAHGHCISSFSPLAASFGHDFWMRHCRAMLWNCDQLFILPLEGWRQSKGMQEEIELAKSNKMPISVIQSTHPLIEDISESWLTRNLPDAVFFPWKQS